MPGRAAVSAGRAGAALHGAAWLLNHHKAQGESKAELLESGEGAQTLLPVCSMRQGSVPTKLMKVFEKQQAMEKDCHERGTRRPMQFACSCNFGWQLCPECL